MQHFHLLDILPSGCAGSSCEGGEGADGVPNEHRRIVSELENEVCRKERSFGEDETTVRANWFLQENLGLAMEEVAKSVNTPMAWGRPPIQFLTIDNVCP